MQLKKVVQVLETLKTQLVKMEIFKKISKSMAEKEQAVNVLSVKVLYKKKLFLIDQLFFAIFVKNN